MTRPWSPALLAPLLIELIGCAHMDAAPSPSTGDRPIAQAATSDRTIAQAATSDRQIVRAAASDRQVVPAAHQGPAPPPPCQVPPCPGVAAAVGPEPLPAEMSGPQPVDAFIQRALAENRTVQAAFHNVQSLRHRIPQVTRLEDPVASNVVFPIPSVAPQYSLMGYNPYNLTLAQTFPWFGTLALRGAVANGDVQIAVAELAAAQLDAVSAVKRSYFDLYAGQKTDEILAANRELLDYFHSLARERMKTGGTAQDAIQSEILLNQLDRDRATNQQAIGTARAALARQVHVSPEAEIQTLPEPPLATVPQQVERLYELAIAARPELRGRLEAIARDETAVELARKRFYPNITLGLTYMDMEKTNAQTPRTAGGFPNVGLFVAFNLPVYRDKYRAGVCEARERAMADAKLYEAQRDETYSEIYDLMTQARVQQNVLGLLRDDILPRSQRTLALARTDYAKANVDIAALLSAMRDVLQVQVQITQIEAELGKALALLERAVGMQINEHPPAAAAAPATAPRGAAAPAPAPPAAPPPSSPPAPPAGGPFQQTGARAPRP